jgi:hypothetical protein
VCKARIGIKSLFGWLVFTQTGGKLQWISQTAKKHNELYWLHNGK